MPYIKAKEKKELLELLGLIANGTWIEEKKYYSDISFSYFANSLILDKDWQKKAKRLKRLLK